MRDVVATVLSDSEVFPEPLASGLSKNLDLACAVMALPVCFGLFSSCSFLVVFPAGFSTLTSAETTALTTTHNSELCVVYYYCDVLSYKQLSLQSCPAAVNIQAILRLSQVFVISSRGPRTEEKPTANSSTFSGFTHGEALAHNIGVPTSTTTARPPNTTRCNTNKHYYFILF